MGKLRLTEFKEGEEVLGKNELVQQNNESLEEFVKRVVEKWQEASKVKISER